MRGNQTRMNMNDILNTISTIVLTEFSDGQSRSMKQGTGFYYSRMAPKDGTGPQWRKIEDMWLITNRHVLIPKNNNTEFSPTYVTFCLRKVGLNGILEWDPIRLTHDELELLAKFHATKSVDVAALNISSLVLSRLNEASKTGEKYLPPYFLHSDKFAGKNHIEAEASSDVLVAGYPKGFYDEVNLFPIVKSGIIASRWGAGFMGQPYFLIDAKLFPGSSGSVVLSKPIDFVIVDGSPLFSDEKQFAFLGVFSGEPQREETPVQVGDLVIIEKSRFDLGVVWYAELVEEVLENGISLSEALSDGV